MSIVLEGVTRRFGGQLVVDRLSMEVRDGELFVLLGSSGSGKSTALRLIAGLLLPDAGRILLHGENVTFLPPQKRGTGFVFQNYSIFRHMSVAENVEFGLKIRNVAPAQRARTRDELLELVGLVGFGSRRPHQLSGGQQQRVALARALAYQPRVLLLDEPFGALDARIRKQIRRSFSEIQRKLGVTTILVTHDQEEAFDLADRLGVIDRGHLLEVGTPEDLYHRPRSGFVATFVGAANVLVGRTTRGRALFGHLNVSIPPDVPHEDGQRVQVLFRPEDVEISPDPPDEGTPLLGSGRIQEESFAGATRRIRLRLPRLTGGTRQIAPTIPFGEQNMLIDAILPAQDPVPEGDVFVALRRWHILERPAPRLLILPHEDTLPVGAALGHRIGGLMTILGVAEDVDAVETVTADLKRRLKDTDLADSPVRVRQGRGPEQILAEQSENLYDMLLLPAAPGRLEPPAEILDEVLAHTDVPFLVPRRGPCAFQHLLVCTAGGEPGKHTVRFATWLGRRLGARVTVLLVTAEEGPAPAADAHLRAACDSLRALDIPADSLLGRAPRPGPEILAQAHQGAFDLVVVGGPAPSPPRLLGPDDVTRQVLAGCEKPVLVVPMEEP